MERNEIRNTVVKYLTRAIAIEEAAVDTSRSMKELGANSLDIVEVVSSTMRELRVRVPRSELDKLENVDDLIDLLLDHAQQRAEEPVSL